ncbi:hypothetical protein INT47_009505, partial [Mucor saturninus]
MSDPTISDKQANLGAACFRCRGFRHACDRRKPSCSRCHRRGIDCVYPEAAPTLKKLQQVTETLDVRIKEFGDRLKTGEVAPNESKNEVSSPFAESVISTYSEDTYTDDMMMDEEPTGRVRRRKVASTNSFSVYPCTKCFKDLQQCDLTLPRCSRCEENNFECEFRKTEPKANHVSQVLTTMNTVMDQWQDSIDRMSKESSQRTRELSAKASYSLKVKPYQTKWNLTTGNKKLSLETNVNSCSDFSKLMDQLKQTINPQNNDQHSASTDLANVPIMEFDSTSLLHSTSGFDIWDAWSSSVRAMPQDYPIDISQELTDNLIELYCRTPCCSSTRIPIIDTSDFLLRYRSPDPKKRPEKVLIYAVCAMAARNAFQMHVWSKRPSSQAPQYNMGKALSVAYSLRGREELSDCFDEPTFERCQGAFLLSYCNYQNGYTSVIYYYEWFAYTMAVQIGLYDDKRELTQYESMLVWCIYYFNTWYKAIQGSTGGDQKGLSQCKPYCAIPNLIRRPDPTLSSELGEEHKEQVIHYYVWNSWVYLINLQVLRDQSLARLISYQSNGRPDTSLPQDLLVMQETLKEFHQSLPIEWQSPHLENTNNKQSCCDPPTLSQSTTAHLSEDFQIDVESFASYSINIVHAYYSINQIILYQAFVPMDRIPGTAISIRCLDTSLNAAKSISQIFERMVQQKQECHVPLMGFLFANIIYRKLLSYPNDRYYELGKFGLLQSLEISKSSVNYTYDCEMARTLVDVMEQDIQFSILQRSPNNSFMSMDCSGDSCTSPPISSPPNYTPLGQTMKE